MLKKTDTSIAKTTKITRDLIRRLIACIVLPSIL
jgi:hypothetical protein